jgi:hypothetical protein
MKNIFIKIVNTSRSGKIIYYLTSTLKYEITIDLQYVVTNKK